MNKVARRLLFLCVWILPGIVPAAAAEKDPLAVEVAERMMAAMGGRNALEAGRLLRFDFVMERDGEPAAAYRHWWDRQTGRYRLEGVTEDEREFRVIFNVNDRQGRAWVDGGILEGEDAAAMLELAYERFVNDTYWLLMPWKWLDPGVNLAYEGEQLLQGSTFDVVHLSFEGGTGLTSGDQYWGYVSRETGRMELWEHMLQRDDGTPGGGKRTSFAWIDWQDAGGGVMLSTRKETVDEAGRPFAIVFPVARISGEAPDGIFNPILRPPSKAPPAEAVGTSPVDAGVNEVLIVLNKSDHTATLLETQRWNVLRTVPTGIGPHEGAVSRDGKTLYVTDYGAREPGNTITVIDIPNGNVIRTVELGEHGRPHGIVLGRDGAVWVTTEATKSVLKLHPKTLAIEKVFRTDQDVTHMIVLSPDGKRAYTANIGSGTMTAIDTVGGQVKSIETGRGSEGIDITPGGREVWVTNREDNTVSVVNTRTLEVEANLPTCEFPIRVKITSDSTKALVTCARSNELQVFNRPQRTEIARVPLFRIEAPIGIVLSPDDRYAFVAASQSDMVMMVDLQGMMLRAGFFSGREPDGMAWAQW